MNPLPSSISGGQKAQRVGANFEKAILLSAMVIHERGSVALESLPKCGAQFTGKNKAHPLPIPCDFIGTVVGPGDAIFFDAKSCGEKKYGIDLADPDILKRHQAAFLNRMALAGAIAGILVECRMHGTYLWLCGRHLGADRAFTAWHDERWITLGEIRRHVQFSELVRAYLGEPLPAKEGHAKR